MNSQNSAATTVDEEPHKGSPIAASIRRRPNSAVTVETFVTAENSPAPSSTRKRFNKKQIFFFFLVQLVVLCGVFALGWYLGFVGLIGGKKDIKDISPDEIENLYDLLKESIARFDEWGIKYWLVGGSLIGASRNTPPGPMAWDGLLSNEINFV
jgi:hypothetical protein